MVTGGLRFYGHTIGILMVNTRFPRIIGDIGNANTFSFPVRYIVVKEVTPFNVADQPDRARRTILKPMIESAQELAQEGVNAITTSCGFLALFQKEIANSVDVPVFTSSLMQIPMVNLALGGNRKIGVLTADASSLTKEHLQAVGVDDSISLVIQGLENAPEFSRSIRRNGIDMDVDKVRLEVIERSMKLRESNVGAIVFECSNLPPYAQAVRSATGLPVFDLVSLVNYVHDAVAKSP